MDSLWSARKQALWASLAVRPEGTQIWSTDVAVPISRLAEIIGIATLTKNRAAEGAWLLTILFSAEISKKRASTLGLFNSVLGHVGDGNFHQVVMYDPTKSEQQEAVQECVDAMMIKALEMEGTVSVSLQTLTNTLSVAARGSSGLPTDIKLGRAWHRPRQKGKVSRLYLH
jgi:D-lactate dehydrogenase (cytochrome)